MKERYSVLMHKDSPVCAVAFDSRGYVQQVPEVMDERLLPCAEAQGEQELRLGIQRWLLRRTSGRNRSDYIPLRTFYGNDLFTSKYKSALSDSYWILPAGEDTEWDKVSPFKNWDPDEDEYFGILNDPENTCRLSRTSPNLTLPGNEHRFWFKDEEVLGIISESAQSDMRRVKVAKEIGVDWCFYPRKYMVLCGTIYSFHPVEFTEEIERVPFDFYYDSVSDPSLSRMENLEKCCSQMGIGNWKKFFGAVCKFDDAVGNKERELASLGILRNAITLEPIGFEKL